MQRVALFLALPILLVDSLGGIIAGLWLALMGQWAAIGIGLGIAILGTLVLGFILMLGMLLAAPGAALLEARHFVLGFALSGLSLLYTYFVLGVWSLFILGMFLKMPAPLTHAIPFGLWGYTVATAPIAFMASKERDDASGSHIVAIATQVGLLGCVAVVLGSGRAPVGAAVFAAVMMLGLVTQLALAVSAVREHRRGAV